MKYKNIFLLNLALTLAIMNAPAFAQSKSASNPSATVAYLTDVEGKWQKFEDFLDKNPNVYRDAQGKIQLADGVTFVYGGDATDSGLDDIKVIDTLLSLKARYPERVKIIGGNRDLGKFALAKFVKEPLPRKIREKFIERGIPDTFTNRVKFLLSSSGYKQGFENRKKEIAALEGINPTDDEVALRVVADMAPGGRMRKLLENTQIVYRDGETLFVHGAILDENFGRIGGRNYPVYNDVNQWEIESNAWYRGELEHFAKTGDASWLLSYARPDPYTGKNPSSVVTARYTDRKGNSRMPSDKLIDLLKQNGIRRIVVGHTPQGDSPSILRDRGFEIILADNTDAPHGSKIFITGDTVELQSKVKLASGEESFAMKWAIDEKTWLGHRLESNDHLLKAQLASGDWVSFQVAPPPTFEVDQNVLTSREVRKAGVKNDPVPSPVKSFLMGLCPSVFGE